MPFSGPNDPKLPSNLDDLSDSEKQKWVDTWNGVYASCIEDDGEADQCEQLAFATANKNLERSSIVIPEESKPMADEERKVLKQIFTLLRGMFSPEQKVKDLEEDKDRAVALGMVWENLWNALEGPDGWPTGFPVDFYVDETDRVYAIVAKEGKLFRLDVKTDDSGNVTFGKEIEVMEQHVPRTSLTMTRQVDGRTRVTAVVCTAVMNRVAEIDSRAMFDSFVRHAEETGEYPIVNFHHQGKNARLGQADFLARDDYLYIASYLFDDNKFGRAAAKGFENDPDYWGHSIEFNATDGELVEVADGVEIPVYLEGVNDVISILGETRAAALFTAEKVQQGVQRMDETVKADLVKLLDGDEALADEFEESADGTNQRIKDENMIARSTDAEETESEEEVEETETETEDVEETETEEEEVEETDLDEEPVTQEFEVNDSVIDAVADRVLSRMVEKLDGVTSELAELVNRYNQSTAATNQNFRSLNDRLAELEKPAEKRRREDIAQLPSQGKVELIFRPSAVNGQPDEEEVLDGSTYAEAAAATTEKWSGHN